MSAVNNPDWEPVVLRKKTKAEKKKGPTFTPPKEKEFDEAKKKAKISTKLRQEIVHYRTAKKMKQKDLARIINQPVTVVAAYENGSAIPDNKIVMKMQKALKCKFSVYK